MSDLVAWLHKQINEDAEKAPVWHDLECDIHDHTASVRGLEMLGMVPGAVCDCNGPARVLAEVEFKRKLLADYENDVTWSMDTLRDLARTVYRGRPGYDEAVKA